MADNEKKTNVNTLKCLQPNCGHEWVPRKEDVRQCPRCKSAYWNQPREDEEK